MTNNVFNYQQALEKHIEQDALSQHHYAMIRQAKAYMEQHYFEKIDLPALARTASMSRFHFVRMFKNVYGLSPIQYLRDLRINKARQLLKQGKAVTEICFDVGYDSPTTFANIFKRAVGQTPKAYQISNIE